jgi:ribose transport system substrate-binding protein
VRAVRELKWEKYAAIVGQDCIPEALEEMSQAGSPLIASVSHQAHTYGPRLIHLGLAILAGQRVPPYNYVEHKLVPAEAAREASRHPEAVL